MTDMEKHALRTPMLGAAYYPETWDESEQEHDIKMMVESGCNVMRMAEFAWHNMEPRDGEFDFSWLHRVMDRLWAAGISVILGTPSACPPRWLEEKHPDMMTVNEDGLPSLHGGRRSCCSNNPHYNFYSARIAEAMGKEFGTDERVIGWQIDNEIYVKNDGKRWGCYCDDCRRGFTAFLEKKYGTVEELNRRWNSNIFSQWYDRFDQVPMPARTWQTPCLLADWKEFQAEAHLDFVKMQIDILHRYTKAPVGTDIMPKLALDYEAIADMSDVMQFNHYRDEGNLWQCIMWFDYLRTLKDRPFWNTETSTCWNGSNVITNQIRCAGFCEAVSWMPVIHGGEANLYWLWRQHWGGGELMHGSVLYASGRPMHTFGEVQSVAAGFEKSSEFINGTKVQTDVALLLSAHNDRLMEMQPIIADGAAAQWVYTDRVQKTHMRLVEHGIRPDVIGVNKSLDNYKLFFTPAAMTLEIGDLSARIEEWVKGGGTWFAGAMTDIRTVDGTHYTDRETGMLERLTGAALVHQVPDNAHRVTCTWANGEEFSANTWLQLFDVPADAEVLATVTGDFYPALKGKAIAFKKKVGRGTVIVLGTLPAEADMKKLSDMALAESGVRRFDASPNLTIAYREGEAGAGYAMVEYRGQPATFTADTPMTDILTGETVSGTVQVKPFGVRILKK